MFKRGANANEQRKIVNMANEGESTKTISRYLKIEEEIVKKFMPKKKKAAKKSD